VLGQQLRGQGVALSEHRVQHGPGVVAASRALALVVHGAQVGGVLLALQPNRAGGHEGNSEASSARRENAVEPNERQSILHY
jgi:hypothetical protein